MIISIANTSSTQLLHILEQISPRKYFLDRQAGGNGWKLYFSIPMRVEIDDPKMATWALLKLKNDIQSHT